jgi:hypothetical protein
VRIRLGVGARREWESAAAAALIPSAGVALRRPERTICCWGEVGLLFGASERKIVVGKTHAQKGEKFGWRGHRRLK